MNIDGRYKEFKPQITEDISDLLLQAHTWPPEAMKQRRRVSQRDRDRPQKHARGSTHETRRRQTGGQTETGDSHGIGNKNGSPSLSQHKRS